MGTETQSNTRETQKFINAKELHDDKKLATDVEGVSKMIAEWDASKAKELFKNYRVEGIGNLQSAITRIDLQNRAKDGRIIPTQPDSIMPSSNGDEPISALVKNRSNLAKLIQLYIIAHDASVQKKDFAKSLAWVDGDLERFTMQWLTQVIGATRNRSALDNMKNEIDQNTRRAPLGAMGVDVETDIRNKWAINDDLRSKREMSVDLLGDNLVIKSYGQESFVDLKTGKIYLGGLFSRQEYPLTVHLVRDRDSKQNPLFIESEVNRTNIKNAMKLMNLVHFVVKEFMNDDKKWTIKDMEKPFYVVNGGIALDNAVLTDTNIVKRKTLDGLLLDARTNMTQNPELLARFLNDIFRSKNPQWTLDRGSTHVGKQKPISDKP